MATEQETRDGVTMLEHLGGRAKLKEFVDYFHHSVLADDLLGEMFAKGKPTHAAHLLAFFEEVMGGRKGYTEHYNGVEGLFDAHEGLAITDEQRRRFVALMLAAADAVGLPNDERFRSALAARIEAGSMFSMILSQPGAARLWPWPPVGTYEW
nr:globin [uncultured bacterium]ASV47012.1 globin [uncultured bacterium]